MSARHGANEDLRSLFATQRQATAADLEQARPAGLEQSQPAAGAQSQLGQAANPACFAYYFRHIRPFARTQQFQRKKSIEIHGRILL
jgi:hypothetical protein